LTSEWLTQLAEQPTEQAFATLNANGLFTPRTAADAAELALAYARVNPGEVVRWLPLVEALTSATGGEGTTQGMLAYARARLALREGEFEAAEAALLEARALWQAAGDNLGAARTGLGLTQLLAVQSRFEEAQRTIEATIAELAAIGGAEAMLVAMDARQNLGTLLSYQERFAEAAAINEELRTGYLDLMAQAPTPGDAAFLQTQLALVERDLALALTYLDEPQAAETLLASAVERLSLPESRADRGQTRTNLGHVYIRTGRYAQAVTELDAATLDLLGTMDVDSVPELWPAADVLFLEQGSAYLALNLLPEADAALRRAEQIMRATQQRYELGQVLVLRGVLEWQRGNAAAAAGALAEAQTIFAEQDNAYWLHRVGLAQAALALRNGDFAAAAGRVAELRAGLESAQEAVAGAEGALTWDQATITELHVAEARLGLATADLSRARGAIEAAVAALGLGAPDDQTAALPQYHLHVLHAAGQLARAEGRTNDARRLFLRALDLLEAQRGMLPIEELRTAFLADKTAIYVDTVLSLLDLPAADPTTIADAFAIVERSRSRALLERLLTSVDDVQAAGDMAPDVRAQVTETRRRLYWLYNQLLGGETGSRGVMPTFTEEIRAREAALQRLEWQRSQWLQQAQPITLVELQRGLAAGQTALVYFIAGDEVMAFVVGCDAAQVVRNLATVAERHGARLLDGARLALQGLYDLLIAPLEGLLAAQAPERLLIIPYGSLHLLPFHSFWNGKAYLLELYEVAYAASGSLAVRQHDGGTSPLCALAGIAVRDSAIPQAETEVRSAARHFERVQVYLDEQAGLAGLWEAAQAGDVLHMATHGVFRPDNPFFSALKLADGWIDVRTIYRLPLNARLVVLSACESGAVQVQGSDEAIGLARGFLGAGAETLVVSLWNVHDASAALLMERFYAHLTDQAVRPAAALRAVQREAARDNRHPYYWAPYVVMGDSS
jgi:CHAT domain-containing protein/tetratricopeptide (TPR) repeat protein